MPCGGPPGGAPCGGIMPCGRGPPGGCIGMPGRMPGGIMPGGGGLPPGGGCITHRQAMLCATSPSLTLSSCLQWFAPLNTPFYLRTKYKTGRVHASCTALQVVVVVAVSGWRGASLRGGAELARRRRRRLSFPAGETCHARSTSSRWCSWCAHPTHTPTPLARLLRACSPRKPAGVRQRLLHRRLLRKPARDRCAGRLGRGQVGFAESVHARRVPSRLQRHHRRRFRDAAD